MAFRTRSNHLPALVALLLTGSTAMAEPQEPARPALALASATVSIAGNSNIHAYTAATTTVRLARLQFTPETTGGLLEAVQTPGALAVLEVVVAAKSLSSPKEGLDKNMHKALKVEAHPELTFHLARVERDGGGGLKAVGTLRIAGVEREVAWALTTERQDDRLMVHGHTVVLMTDYGIKPPTAMLGMLKTDPKVKVTFDIALTVPLT